MSATQWKISGDLVVVREDDRVALALEPQDRVDVVREGRPFDRRDDAAHAFVEGASVRSRTVSWTSHDLILTAEHICRYT